MTYLLDTATWLNHALEPAVLPARIAALVGAMESKGLCSVSLLESAILYRLGRLDIVDTLEQFLSSALAADIELIDLTANIALATNDLTRGFPGDPFDRAIAATARVRNLTLITPDPVIRDARDAAGQPFCRIEFYPFRPSRARRCRR